MKGPVVIATGGTGGHVYPALATARALERLGRRVCFLTDARGARYLEGVEAVERIDAASPSGNLLRRLQAILRLLSGSVAAARRIRQRQGSVVAAFGGYASVPAVAASAWLGRPVLLHEQNAVLGKANRLACRFARVLALSFEDTEAVPARMRDRTVVTGNPVRPGFVATRIRRPGEGNEYRLLVLGGSQGARIFGEVVPEAIARLPADLRGCLRVSLQVRPEATDGVRERCRELRLDGVEISGFFHDVADRLADTDLVVSRSGASTITELLCLGRPSILVPYPHAADDHQHANALRLARAGAACLVPEGELAPERLARELTELLGDRRRLARMADAASRLARPDADQRLARLILSCMEGERP